MGTNGGLGKKQIFAGLGKTARFIDLGEGLKTSYIHFNNIYNRVYRLKRAQKKAEYSAFFW
jgi:hypothetical protein